MQAVILAGGSKSRLYPMTAALAKPMMPLFDKPVLEHTIKHLAKHGIKDIIIATCRDAAGIVNHFGDGSRWDVNIRYSIEHTPRGTAGGVKLLQKTLDHTFVVLSADVVTDVDISGAIAKHWANSALVTILTSECDDPTQYGVIKHDSSGRITHFIEKPKSNQIDSHTVSTGIYIMEPEALSCIPYDEPAEFACHTFPRMLSNQEMMYALDMGGYWCDVGDSMSCERVHADALMGNLKLDLPAREATPGVWVGRGATVHSSAQISSPVYIGAGAVIGENVTLGKRTIIGSDAVIGDGCDLARCVIGTGTHIGRCTNVKDSIVYGRYDMLEDSFIVNQTLLSGMAYSADDKENEEKRPIIRKAKQPSNEAVDVSERQRVDTST